MPWEGQLEGRDPLGHSPSVRVVRASVMSKTHFPNSRDPGRDVPVNTAHFELSS